MVYHDKSTNQFTRRQLKRATKRIRSAGVILFRRSVSPLDYGKQSRSMLRFEEEARDWDWTDRIEYLPLD